jgi:hypothetical protein
LFLYVERSPLRIYYHVIDKYLYAGSDDVKFYGQALQ